MGNVLAGQGHQIDIYIPWRPFLWRIVGGLPLRGLPQDTALLKRLQDAEQVQSMDDPALKPWHLKIFVQLNDSEGKPAETGTIEEWWVGPGKFQRVFAFPSYSATELGVGKQTSAHYWQNAAAISYAATTGRSTAPYSACPCNRSLSPRSASGKNKVKTDPL
jgi:hypothetical protein